MKTKLAVLTIFYCCLIACNGKKSETIARHSTEVQEPQNLVERGKYLVDVTGCADCHTPKRMTPKGPVNDMEKYMMGFETAKGLPPVPENVPLGPWVLFKGDLTAAVGPWGTSYAGNLTPHETGIGTWSLAQFTKALREFKFKGLDQGRPIMPPMPKHYAHLSDTDIEAMFAFLKTIKPIDNVVPGHQPPKP